MNSSSDFDSGGCAGAGAARVLGVDLGVEAFDQLVVGDGGFRDLDPIPLINTRCMRCFFPLHPRGATAARPVSRVIAPHPFTLN